MEYTKTPWKKDGIQIITVGGIIARCPVPQHGGVFDCEANAERIVHCCNHFDEVVEALSAAQMNYEDYHGFPHKKWEQVLKNAQQ